jgi:hypothetical protein
MATLVKRRNRGEEDFEILFPEFSISVGSVRFAIHEYTIVEGARLSGMARTALEAHKTGDSDDLTRLLADNCQRDPLEIAGLSEMDFAALVAGFERANQRWLTVDKPTGKPERWSSVVQSLVSHGHPLPAIRGYTLRQVYLFNDAIHRLSSRERAARIVDGSLGFSGGDEAKDAIKSFKRAGE